MDKNKGVNLMNNKIKDLLNLIKENPELEIMPMVATECVAGDDYCYWAALWGKAEIDRYYPCDERVYFESTDYEELVEKYMDTIAEGYKTPPEFLEEMAKDMVNNLGWIKAIIVNIDSL